MNRAGLWVAVILVAGFLALLALNWPGQLSYDSVMQLAEGRAGFYHSWHPPVMAFLLGLFDRLVPGTGLFMLFTGALALFSFLVFAAPARATPASVALALLVALSPQLLLYQGIVWKDVLFADAALAGFAALVIAVGPRRIAWLLPAALLLALAMMARQNGLVIVPVAAFALGAVLWRRMAPGKAVGAALLFLVAIMSCGFGGETLLALRGDHGEDARDEIRVAQSYDLAGMMKRDAAFRPSRLRTGDPALAAMLATRGVADFTPVWIDPLLNDGALHDAIAAAPPGLIFAQWRGAILGHPGVYLATRWADFAWVTATPDRLACHALYTGVDGPPAVMASLGLHPRWRLQERLHNAYGLALRDTPFFSHLLFAGLAAALLVALLRRRRDTDLVAAGLLAAALAFATSFFVVSIACDYRYLYFLDLAAMAGLLAVATRKS